MALWIILGVVALLILLLIGLYNGLVTARNRVDNAWSQIDVQLKRRHDLIPNLVEVCKGYMKHEQNVLESVTTARQQAVNISGGSIAERAQVENILTGALRQLFAVAENYPDLKANQNMLALQEELTATENRIAFARQHYNDSVMGYNTQIQQFPANLFAGSFGFQPKVFFELTDPAQREPVKVQF
ncbi:LemA family protein [Candidatus Acetothermia bacterium]|jgi:LemA protein|nr:LemA family protein [Candidatus Acetothermia bacterium]MCI2432298.1 LemA family protein [Candidatus Acetothermia bacterium]MCI2437423.1 LemA family protein [Candidatus Acetothermia bacterium]